VRNIVDVREITPVRGYSSDLTRKFPETSYKICQPDVFRCQPDVFGRQPRVFGVAVRVKIESRVCFGGRCEHKFVAVRVNPWRCV
jgi:hypothetical protein